MLFIDIFAAFLMGALSGMGIGGGGLLVIYMTLFRGAEQRGAQGINLYFFIFAAVAALFVHCRRRSIRYGDVLALSAVGLPMSLWGSLTAASARPETLRWLFGVMLVAAGGLSVLKSGKSYLQKRKELRKK